MNRRNLVLWGVAATAALPRVATAQASTQNQPEPPLGAATTIARMRQGGLVVLLRHTRTDNGEGEGRNFNLADCSTQRNLNDSGRAQARAIGSWWRTLSLPMDAVYSSAWCRCRDTATLLDLGPVQHLAPLDSMERVEPARTQRALAITAFAATWTGPGNLLLVTHQTNIEAVTGVSPRPGEAVVIDSASILQGRVPPPAA